MRGIDFTWVCACSPSKATQSSRGEISRHPRDTLTISCMYTWRRGLYSARVSTRIARIVSICSQEKVNIAAATPIPLDNHPTSTPQSPCLSYATPVQRPVEPNRKAFLSGWLLLQSHHLARHHQSGERGAGVSSKC